MKAHTLNIPVGGEKNNNKYSVYTQRIVVQEVDHHHCLLLA